MSSSSPLLSICIPTYNRAELLRSALLSLTPQVKELGGTVELIVSDNNSSDHTQEVAEWAQQYGPIRYYRNRINIGSIRNILVLTNELATGQFCWILGDDDMVIAGKLRYLVERLTSNSDLDYFFVNYFFKPIEERDRLIREQNSTYTPALNECMCKDPSERRFNKWEDLLGIENVNPPAMHTAIVSHVFRRSMWRTYSSSLRIEKGQSFSSLDMTFPHVKVLSQAMVGRPAYYLGSPLVLLGQGSQEWGGQWPTLMLSRVDDALALYENLGVDERHLCRCRKFLLQQNKPALLKVVEDPETFDLPRFFLTRFCWRNRRHLNELRGGLIKEVDGNSIRMSPYKLLWEKRHHPTNLARVIAFILLATNMLDFIQPLQIWASKNLPKPVYAALRTARSGVRQRLGRD